MSKVSENMTDLRESPQSEPSPLEESLYRLEQLTRQLRLIGLSAFFLTIAAIGFSFFIAFNLSRVLLSVSSSSSRDTDTYRSMFYFSLFIGGLALGSVMIYESLRRQGDALFEEISDELEWYVQDT